MWLFQSPKNKPKTTRLATYTGKPPRGPVLLYVNTTWCGPCKLARPIMEQVARSVKVVSVDADRHESFAKSLEVPYFPTLLFYHKGVFARYPENTLSNSSVSAVIKWFSTFGFDKTFV